MNVLDITEYNAEDLRMAYQSRWTTQDKLVAVEREMCSRAQETASALEAVHIHNQL